MLCIEEIDLRSVSRSLRERLGPTLHENYLDGRTVIRDVVVTLLECSVYEAEELVDTLEAQEYLHFPRLGDQTHPLDSSQWEIRDTAP